jgi:hypothetical protein
MNRTPSWWGPQTTAPTDFVQQTHFLLRQTGPNGEPGGNAYDEIKKLEQEIDAPRKSAGTAARKASETYTKLMADPKHRKLENEVDTKGGQLASAIEKQSEATREVANAAEKVFEAETQIGGPGNNLSSLQTDLSNAKDKLGDAHDKEVEARNELQAKKLVFDEAQTQIAFAKTALRETRHLAKQLKQAQLLLIDAVQIGKKAAEKRLSDEVEQEKRDRIAKYFAAINIPTEIQLARGDSLPKHIIEHGAKFVRRTDAHIFTALMAALAPLPWQPPENGLRSFIQNLRRNLFMAPNAGANIEPNTYGNLAIAQYGQYRVTLQYMGKPNSWDIVILPAIPVAADTETCLPPPDEVAVLEALPAWSLYEAYDTVSTKNHTTEHRFWLDLSLGSPFNSHGPYAAQIYSSFQIALAAWRTRGRYIRNKWLAREDVKHPGGIDEEYMQGAMPYQKLQEARRVHGSISVGRRATLKNEYDASVVAHKNAVRAVRKRRAAFDAAQTTLAVLIGDKKKILRGLQTKATDAGSAFVIAERKFNTANAELEKIREKSHDAHTSYENWFAGKSERALKLDELDAAKTKDEKLVKDGHAERAKLYAAYERTRADVLARVNAAQTDQTRKLILDELMAEFKLAVTTQTPTSSDAEKQTAKVELDAARAARHADTISDDKLTKERGIFNLAITAYSAVMAQDTVVKTAEADFKNAQDKANDAHAKEQTLEASMKQLKLDLQLPDGVLAKEFYTKTAAFNIAERSLETKTRERDHTKRKFDNLIRDANNAARGIVLAQADYNLAVSNEQTAKQAEVIAQKNLNKGDSDVKTKLKDEKKALADYRDAKSLGVAGIAPVAELNDSKFGDSDDNDDIDTTALLSLELELTPPPSPTPSRDLEAELSGESAEFQLEYHREAFVKESALVFGCTPLDVTLPLFAAADLNSMFGADPLVLLPVDEWPALDLELWRGVRAEFPGIMGLLAQFEDGTAGTDEMTSLITADRLISVPKVGAATE